MMTIPLEQLLTTKTLREPSPLEDPHTTTHYPKHTRTPKNKNKKLKHLYAVGATHLMVVIGSVLTQVMAHYDHGVWHAKIKFNYYYYSDYSTS
jgi:hypothetical protein